MRIFILTLLTAFTLNIPAFAMHQEGHDHSDMDPSVLHEAAAGIGKADDTVVAQINGLVCDFCARALEKVFSKQEEVTGIDVNLNTKLVTIGFKKDANLDDATITKLITDAGYNVVEIKR